MFMWDLPNPFVLALTVQPEAIDHYGHVNNAEYLRYMEQVSWKHSNHLGLTLDDYRQLDRAMVVVRHEIDYQAPAFEGEALQIATWIVSFDQRFTLTRRFQLLRVADGKTLMRGRTRFACIALSSGRPSRLPDAFVAVYRPALIQETDVPA
jgi:acyl-CoA thioester hydrolase